MLSTHKFYRHDKLKTFLLTHKNGTTVIVLLHSPINMLFDTKKSGEYLISSLLFVFRIIIMKNSELK